MVKLEYGLGLRGWNLNPKLQGTRFRNCRKPVRNKLIKPTPATVIPESPPLPPETLSPKTLKFLKASKAPNPKPQHTRKPKA